MYPCCCRRCRCARCRKTWSLLLSQILFVCPCLVVAVVIVSVFGSVWSHERPSITTTTTTTIATATTMQRHTNRIYESKSDQVLQQRPQRQWQQQQRCRATQIEITKARATKYYNNDHNDNGKSNNNAGTHKENLWKQERPSITTTTTTTMVTATTRQGHTNRIYEGEINQVF